MRAARLPRIEAESDHNQHKIKSPTKAEVAAIRLCLRRYSCWLGRSAAPQVRTGLAGILALLVGVLETHSEGFAYSSVALMSDEIVFEPLLNYLASVPAITGKIGSGFSDDGYWWVKFAIDIDHPLAWSVVQELGHVLNYLSLDERLPTAFMPVSPPPYMNGGPRDYLSWVIESKSKDFKPEACAEWLEGRLPRPVSEAEKWNTADEN